jgi:phosphoribosylanthranilate isomerase
MTQNSICHARQGDTLVLRNNPMNESTFSQSATVRRTRVKICGLTRVADVIDAVAAGADALGFVFAPSSPRRVSIAQAQALVAKVPPMVMRVALFVDAAPEFVRAVCDAARPDLVQYHGEERALECAAAGVPYLRAWRISGAEDASRLLESTRPFLGDPLCRGFLVDAPATLGYLGGGAPFAWGLVPVGLAKPTIFAGGLTPENVGALVVDRRPYAVDVSSGVESEPGIKDREKMRRFVHAVQRADEAFENADA